MNTPQYDYYSTGYHQTDTTKRTCEVADCGKSAFAETVLFDTAAREELARIPVCRGCLLVRERLLEALMAHVLVEEELQVA